MLRDWDNWFSQQSTDLLQAMTWRTRTPNLVMANAIRCKAQTGFSPESLATWISVPIGIIDVLTQGRSGPNITSALDQVQSFEPYYKLSPDLNRLQPQSLPSTLNSLLALTPEVHRPTMPNWSELTWQSIKDGGYLAPLKQPGVWAFFLWIDIISTYMTAMSVWRILARLNVQWVVYLLRTLFLNPYVVTVFYYAGPVEMLLAPILIIPMSIDYTRSVLWHASYLARLDALCSSNSNLLEPAVAHDLCYCGPRLWTGSLAGSLKFVLMALRHFVSQAPTTLALAVALCTIVVIWRFWQSIYTWLVDHMTTTVYRSNFSKSVFNPSSVKTGIRVISEGLLNPPNYDDNPHADLAMDRWKAINASALALATKTGLKVVDVCGVASRYSPDARKVTTVVMPRDAANYNAFLRVEQDPTAHVATCEPGEEIRSYQGPVLLSLCDWHYTQDQMSRIFAENGGVVLTIKFRDDGQLVTLGTTNQATYRCTPQMGVYMTVAGGAVYAHGYHAWRDGMIFAGAGGIFRATECNPIGHITPYIITPMPGATRDLDLMPSYVWQSSLFGSDLPGHTTGTLHRTQLNTFLVDLPGDTQHALDQGILIKVADELIHADGPAAEEGARRLLRISLQSLKTLTTEWGALMPFYYQAACTLALERRGDVLGWKKWVPFCSQIEQGVAFIHKHVRRHFTHAVTVVPLQTQAEGQIVDRQLVDRLKNLYLTPRQADLPTGRDGTQRVPNSRDVRPGQNERNGKHQKQGDPATGKPGAGAPATPSPDKVVHAEDSGAGTGHAESVAQAVERRPAVPDVGQPVPTKSPEAPAPSAPPAPAKEGGDEVLPKGGAPRQEGPAQHLPLPTGTDQQARPTGVQDGKSPKQPAVPAKGNDHPPAGKGAGKKKGGKRSG